MSVDPARAEGEAVIDWRRIFDSYWGRVVWGSIGLFLVLPVVVGLVWTAVAHTLRFSDGYGLGVYIGTGIAVLWYTVETYYLRLLAREQAEMAIHPLVIAKVENFADSWAPHAPYQRLVLRNIGHGPALFAEVQQFALTVWSRGEWQIAATPVDVVETRDIAVPRLAATGGFGAIPSNTEIVDSLRPGSGHVTGTYTMTITYRDIEKRRFVSTMRIDELGAELLDHHRLT